jgi:hypothetical protein
MLPELTDSDLIQLGVVNVGWRPTYLSKLPILVRLGEWTNKSEIYMAPSERGRDVCFVSTHVKELGVLSSKLLR